MRTFLIATRGSALALAQANMILGQCRAAFPKLEFALTIIKTTGDELQTASLAKEGQELPKGLFTKELEVALLNGKADLAVHSLKDLPTELPAGLMLGAVGKRADVRDVLIYREEQSDQKQTRGFKAGIKICDFPAGTVVATSSTRRKAQLLTQNPNLKVPDIRGNVGTRMQKVAQKGDLHATVLALAGLTRLGYRIAPSGRLEGENVPADLLATILETEVMLPCVGQGAIGIEVRKQDEEVAAICEALNDVTTQQCVSAERAFLAGMGGGCQSPVAAYAEVKGNELRMRALSFADGPVRRAEASATTTEAIELGHRIAAELKAK
jgi:hydroxymethylbilane synthase